MFNRSAACFESRIPSNLKEKAIELLYALPEDIENPYSTVLDTLNKIYVKQVKKFSISPENHNAIGKSR